MADQKLTERVFLETSNDDDLIHVVQNGASYKQTKVNFLKDVVSTTEGGTRLISGGMVWVTGLTYKSVNLVYEINGVLFSIADDTNVTLDTADPTDPRIDLIYGDDTGVLGKSTGTPAPIPTANTLPSYQFQLKLAFVDTGATAPTGTAIRTVYLENLQEVGGEFDTSESTSGARIALANTTTPIQGTYNIRVIANLVNGDRIDFDHTTPTTFDNFNSLKLSIKNLVAWGNDYIVVELRKGISVSKRLTLNSSRLNVSDITNIQTITLFNADFLTVGGDIDFDGITFYNRIVGSSAMRYQLDEIYINEDTYIVEPVIITASDVTVDTTNFNLNLSSADDTLQKALDTLDDLVTSVGSVEGTAVLSTGEVGGTKFLREDGDGTSSWQTVPSGGDVNKVGTPVNNQVGVWTGDGTIEGDVDLTFDTATNTLSTGILNATSLTASELTASDGSKNIVSLAVATYPSLTELSYVKGVTSAIQTQLTGMVTKALFDANTIIYATTNDTPVALTVGASTFVGRKATGDISAMSLTEVKTLLIDRLEEDATVTGTKNIDWTAYETFRYTLTGACIFSDTNLPASGTKTITIHMDGNFAPTYPAGWTTYVRGEYDGAVRNLITVEYVKAGTPFFVVDISQPD